MLKKTLILSISANLLALSLDSSDIKASAQMHLRLLKPGEKIEFNAPKAKAQISNQNIYQKAIMQAIVQSIKANEPSKALEIASLACEHSCESKELNQAIMKLALDAKDYDKALAASDRILIYAPNDKQAHFAAAKIYAHEKNDELLKAELKELKKLNLSKEELASLENIESSLNAKSGLYAEISAGFSAESNATKISVKGFKYHTPIGSFNILGSNKLSAMAAIAMLNIGYKKSFDNLDNDFWLSSYNKYFLASSSKNLPDISAISLNDSFSKQLNSSINLEANLGIDSVFLRKHYYMSDLRAEVGLLKQYEKFALGAGLETTKYFYKDSDDNALALGAYLKATHFNSSSMQQLRLEFLNTRADKSELVSSDYDSYILSLLNSYIFNNYLVLNASLEIDYDRYKKFHYGFSSYRKDLKLSLNFGLNYAINANNSLNFSLGYLNNHSNQALYSYDNYSARLLYKYRF